MEGTRLTLARKLRGFSKKELAELVKVTPKSIADYENDVTNPSPEIEQRLKQALRFPEAFFNLHTTEPMPEKAISFRARTRLKRSQKDIATAEATLATELSDWCNSKFNLPKTDVPTIEGVDPVLAAEMLRKEWKMGDGAIPNLLALLESHGIRIFFAGEIGNEVDAFSYWEPKTQCPYVFLTTSKSGERRRMDAAHELGHLVMHRNRDMGTSATKEIETEANRFASAFLMPKSTMLKYTPRGFNLRDAVTLKKRWKVSVAAFIYRSHDIGLLTDWQYHNLFKQLSSAGWRTDEPNAIIPEQSEVNKQVITLLSKMPKKLSTASNETALPLELCYQLLTGTSAQVVVGGKTPASKTNGRKADLTVIQ